MTLIATYITRYGVVHASDSNLTSKNGQTGVGKKVFDIPWLNAGLSFSGSYSVDNVPLDEWMEEFIQKCETEDVRTLQEFSECLRLALETGVRPFEVEGGYLIHICGYGSSPVNRSVPEFWFVRNFPGMDEFSGEYQNPTESFYLSEDFVARDYQKSNFKKAFHSVDYHSAYMYVNGTTPGRIGFNVARKQLEGFFSYMWSLNTIRFREPRNLNDAKRIVELYFEVINGLYELSEYQVKYIGGETQTLCVPKPHSSTPSPL